MDSGLPAFLTPMKELGEKDKEPGSDTSEFTRPKADVGQRHRQSVVNRISRDLENEAREQ